MDIASVGGIIVDLFIAAIIITISFIGYKKGLTSVLYKIIAFIVSILIVFVLYKPVSNTIITHTKIDDNIASSIQNVLPDVINTNGEQIEESEAEFSNASVQVINKYISEAVAKSESDIKYYISIQLACTIIRLVTMIILYIVSNVILIVLKFAIDIVGKLPIISTFNSAGGLIYGVIKSFLIIYIILAVLSLVSSLISTWGIIEAIDESFIGSRMYNNNILINLIIK